MKKIVLLFIYLFYFSFVNSQIIYNWQNSKEGWVSGGNCNLTAQPDAMAMRLFAPNATMRSGVLSDNLGINGSDYNLVEVTVKNPTAGSGIARLFIYPPNTNSDTCFYTFPGRYINEWILYLYNLFDSIIRRLIISLHRPNSSFWIKSTLGRG